MKAFGFRFLWGQSVSCIFREMWTYAWFNKKTTRVGEMTARSTRQQTLEKNEKKWKQSDVYVYRKEIEKEKHTHTKEKHKMYNRSSAKKRHKHRTVTSNGTSNEPITNKDRFACFEWSKCVHNTGNQWKLYLKEELFIWFYGDGLFTVISLSEFHSIGWSVCKQNGVVV